MTEILVTREPSAPVDIDVVTGRVITVTSPPEVYVPYIGKTGNWWVAGIDSGVAAQVQGTPGKDADPATVAAIAEAAVNTQAAAEQAQAGATEAADAAKQAAEAAEEALFEAKAARNAVAALPDIVTGAAPCLKTGSYAFTRIYFPRRFAAVPQVVPGALDLSGGWRIVSMVGLTNEYVDLVTNYWNSGNTFTYVAVGKLAD